MTHITDEDIKKGLKERVPEKAAEINQMAFGEVSEYVLVFLRCFVVSRLMY